MMLGAAITKDLLLLSRDRRALAMLVLEELDPV